MVVGNRVHQQGTGPCGHFGQGGCLETDGGHQDGDGQDPHYHLQDAGAHGHKGEAHTLYGTAEDEEEVHEDEGHAGDGKIVLHQCNGFIALQQEGGQLMREEEHNAAKHDIRDQCYLKADTESLADPSVLPRSEVLAGVCTHGVPHGEGRIHEQVVVFAADGISTGVDYAIAIYEELHHHTADGSDGIHKSHGKPVLQQTKVQGPFVMEILPVQADDLDLPKLPEADQRGNYL